MTHLAQLPVFDNPRCFVGVTLNTFSCLLSVAVFDLDFAGSQVRGIGSSSYSDPDEQARKTE